MDNTEIKKILVRRHREQNTSQQNTAAKKNNTDPTKNRTTTGVNPVSGEGCIEKIFAWRMLSVHLCVQPSSTDILFTNWF